MIIDPSFLNKAVVCDFFPDADLHWNVSPWRLLLASSCGNPLWKPDANLSANSGGSFSYSARRAIMFLSALKIIRRIILESTLPWFLCCGGHGLDSQIVRGSTVAAYKAKRTCGEKQDGTTDANSLLVIHGLSSKALRGPRSGPRTAPDKPCCCKVGRLWWPLSLKWHQNSEWHPSHTSLPSNCLCRRHSHDLL